MFSFIIGTIIAYCLIRFIFNFLVPLFRVTRQMKDQVREFNEKMGGNQYRSDTHQYQPNGHQHQSGAYQANSQKKSSPKSKTGDYIDFEEIR